ncbi:hypothetical protein SHPE106448_08145 [Shewanella pealeana]|nr:hypothetical protein [Shewanella pealeana]
MNKIFTYLIIATVLSVSSGCASQKFSEGVDLNLKSKEYEDSKARFNFYDASEGCPSYKDGPLAKHYLGRTMVSSAGTTMHLPANKKIHVFYFKPSNTPGIMAKGGAKEIRRRSVQIELSGENAELQLIKDENDKMKWVVQGSIQLEPATNCAPNENSNSTPQI